MLGVMAGASDRSLVWLHGEVKSPPFSANARLEAGQLLRRLQRGELLGMPHARPMTVIGRRCHELRVQDEAQTWRIVYRLDTDAVVIAAVFSKKTQKTPPDIIATSRRRLKSYDDIVHQRRRP
jgi:phage-related protein